MGAAKILQASKGAVRQKNLRNTGLVGKAFASQLRGQGSIPGWVKPDLEMGTLVAASLNASIMS